MEEIVLRDIFQTFLKRKGSFFLIVILAVIVGVFYTYKMTTPKYNASTTLLLAKSIDNKNAATAESITQTDISLNSKLITTYNEVIKSKSVVREVIQNLDMSDLTEEGITKNIEVKSVKDTELIQITVSNINPNYPAKIANEIANVFSKKVSEVYNINNINVLDKAETPTDPYNINKYRDIGIATLIGIALAGFYIFIAYTFDNTIKTEQDVENIKGLIVLGKIPEYNINKRTRGGKSGKRVNHK